jgi:hypothetical protein
VPINFIDLTHLITLKLASYLTGGAARLKDKTDVQAVIIYASLGKEVAEQLDPYVREEYLKTWNEVQSIKKEE